MRRRLFAIALALLANLPVAAGASETRGFVDAAGRKVEVPVDIRRVMPAGPPASVLLYALAPDKMAGWVRPLSEEQKASIAAPWRDLPVIGRLTGKESDADAATVGKVRPDLILDIGTVDAGYAALADRIEKETGVPYILLDGSLRKTPETLRALGRLLGKDADGEALAGYAEAVLARVDAAVAAQPADGKLLVYYARGKDGLETGGGNAINTEFLGVVGAANVAAGEGGDELVRVTVDQIAAWKPYVILTLEPAFKDAAEKDPAWSRIPAVAEKRLHVAPALPFGWIDSPPGLNRLIGLDWLISVLYPDFSRADLPRQARAFYKLFYHVDLTDAQLAALLGGDR
jgi:iron complex transport system substrate-binding protein